MSGSMQNAADDKRITVDDLKQKTMQVRDLAEAETRAVTRTVLERDVTKIVAVGVVAVVAALSLAYYLGTRSARDGLRDLA
ncbi:MAG TPA: hypothetical protein DCP20_09440 [Coriobacteriia bacterium]|nr:hypothetical protein [Coriobacteriia bacterium]